MENRFMKNLQYPQIVFCFNELRSLAQCKAEMPLWLHDKVTSANINLSEPRKLSDLQTEFYSLLSDFLKEG
jgi:hypothetical protein